MKRLRAAIAATLNPGWTTAVRTSVAMFIVLPAALLAAGPADASSNAPKDKAVRAEVRVVNQHGTPLEPATVMACPYEAGVVNCGHLVAAPTNAEGFAEIRLSKGVRYQITAFVLNPQPPWECPGYIFNGGEFYFAVNPFSADAKHVPSATTLIIHQPVSNECVPLPVSDDRGTALTSANMFVCPLAADGTPCATATYPNRDPDGTLRLNVDPTVTYRLTPFIANSGWPCPQYISPTGDTFHFGDTRDILGADLIAGTTFVIHHPSTEEC